MFVESSLPNLIVNVKIPNWIESFIQSFIDFAYKLESRKNPIKRSVTGKYENLVGLIIRLAAFLEERWGRNLYIYIYNGVSMDM